MNAVEHARQAGILFPAGGIGSMAGADKLPGWADIYGDSGDSGAGGGDWGCDGANTTSTSQVRKLN